MFIKSQEGIFYDPDMGHLRDFLVVLDIKLAEIESQIALSPDPDTDGLFESGEYWIGLGLVAAQKYISSKAGEFKSAQRNVIMGLGPKIKSGETVVTVLNNGANFWKHQGDWLSEDGKCSVFNEPERTDSDVYYMYSPDRRGMDTVKFMGKIDAGGDYANSNLVACILGEGFSSMFQLVPLLEEWQENIYHMYQNKKLIRRGLA